MSESPPAVSLHERLRARQPKTYVTCALIAANVAVFMAMYASGAKLGLSPSDVHLRWGANFGPATQDGEWWRLGSAMFLHFGVLHLLMNSWALWDGGQFVERMFGASRFAAIYLLSGVSGNLVSLDFYQGSSITGGASGAIFGVYGALLVYLWQERRSLNPREFRWLFWGAVAFSCVAIVLGLLVSGIDNAAHMGGFVGGMLCGACLMPAAGRRCRCGVRFGAAVVLLLSWGVLVSHLPAAPYRWRDEASARAEIGRFLKSEAAVSEAWAEILGEREDASFEDLAGQIEARIADRYERSFEELAQLSISPLLPSAPNIEKLRDYAAVRRDASRRVAEALRGNDAVRLREALAIERKSRPPGGLENRRPQ